MAVRTKQIDSTLLSTTTTLQALFTSIGSVTKYTLILSKDVTLTQNTTQTSNIHIDFVNGAKIITGTYTYTCNGSHNTDIMHQIWDDSGGGSVSYGSAPKVPFVRPEWWGVDGTNDQAEFAKAAKAISSSGGVVLGLTTANYVFSSSCEIPYSNITIDLCWATVNMNAVTSGKGYAFWFYYYADLPFEDNHPQNRTTNYRKYQIYQNYDNTPYFDDIDYFDPAEFGGADARLTNVCVKNGTVVCNAAYSGALEFQNCDGVTAKNINVIPGTSAGGSNVFVVGFCSDVNFYKVSTDDFASKCVYNMHFYWSFGVHLDSCVVRGGSSYIINFKHCVNSSITNSQTYGREGEMLGYNRIAYGSHGIIIDNCTFRSGGLSLGSSIEFRWIYDISLTNITFDHSFFAVQNIRDIKCDLLRVKNNRFITIEKSEIFSETRTIDDGVQNSAYFKYDEDYDVVSEATVYGVHHYRYLVFPEGANLKNAVFTRCTHEYTEYPGATILYGIYDGLAPSILDADMKDSVTGMLKLSLTSDFTEIGNYCSCIENVTFNDCSIGQLSDLTNSNTYCFREGRTVYKNVTFNNCKFYGYKIGGPRFWKFDEVSFNRCGFFQGTADASFSLSAINKVTFTECFMSNVFYFLYLQNIESISDGYRKIEFFGCDAICPVSDKSLTYVKGALSVAGVFSFINNTITGTRFLYVRADIVDVTTVHNIIVDSDLNTNGKIVSKMGVGQFGVTPPTSIPAHIADAAVAAGANPTKAEFDAVVGIVNALLLRDENFGRQATS